MYELEVMERSTHRVFKKRYREYPAAVRFYQRVTRGTALVLISCNFDPYK